MGVIDGNPVSAAYTNPLYLDATNDDTMFGKLTMNDAGAGSGSSITNIQKEFNAIASFTGNAVNGALSNLPPFSNNEGFGSDDLFTRLDAVSGKFHSVTGHGHTGAAGDGPQIAAAAIGAVPLQSYPNEGTMLAGITGSSVDVSTELTGKVPSSLSTVEGVVVNSPYNHILIKQGSGPNINDNYVDAFGNIVQGRLTYSFPTWTLSFHVDIAGVETPYSFASASDIKWFYQELFNPMGSPPVYSNLFFIPSDNATSDVVDASTTQRGVVNTTTQGFSGNKFFTGDLNAQAKMIGDKVVDNTTTGLTAAMPAPSKFVVEITNASLVSIGTITGGTDAQYFIAINKTGADIKILNYTVSNGIYTGTGSDIFFKKDSAALFVYVNSLSAWFVCSGSGGGDEQIYPIPIAANVTTFTNLSGLSFPLASVSGLQISYSIKETSSLKFRTGLFTVATDGTNVSYFDETHSETAQIGQGSEGLQLDAQISGGFVNIRFKNSDTVNGATMQCFVKRFI